MIKLFVDSGSSIRESEKEKYDVEILPLKIFLNGKEYRGGVDLSMDEFYHYLIDEDLFPKTSLPSPGDEKERVMRCVENGYDVVIHGYDCNKKDDEYEPNKVIPRKMFGDAQALQVAYRCGTMFLVKYF